MARRNSGLIATPLFVAATRPPMRWGVTYAALLFNLVFTMEMFLLGRNLFALLLCLPIHGICMLLCARDPRCFDLILQCARVRLPAMLGNLRYWQASSYSPLQIDLPDLRGRRRNRDVVVRVMPGSHASRWSKVASAVPDGPAAHKAGLSC